MFYTSTVYTLTKEYFDFSDNPSCVLHIASCQDVNETVKVFTPKKLKKCQKILIARKEQVKSKLFHSIVLPESVDSFSGYHTSCYSNFTALPKQKWESIEIPSRYISTFSTAKYNDRNTDLYFLYVQLFRTYIHFRFN